MNLHQISLKSLFRKCGHGVILAAVLTVVAIVALAIPAHVPG